MEKTQNVYNQIELRSYPFFKGMGSQSNCTYVSLIFTFIHKGKITDFLKYNTLTYTVN